MTSADIPNQQAVLPRLIEQWLVDPRLPYCLLALVFVIFLPLLNSSLILDDYIEKVMIAGSSSIGDVGPVTNIYRYLDGSAETTTTLRNIGVVPWWTPDEFKLSFWRPVAQLTHVFDYTLFPNSPWVMRLQTLLWYCALAFAVYSLYRHVIGATAVAGLALVFFVIDDAHSLPIYFLATRSAMIAAFFAVLSLLAYIRARENNSTAMFLASLGCLLTALFSNEGAVGITAYYFAYECFLSRSRPSRRLLALSLPAVVVIGWRLLYDHFGHGVVGSREYFDPMQDPALFLQIAKDHIPVLFAGQWALPPSDIYIMLIPQNQELMQQLGLGVLALVIVLLIPVLKEAANRFWFVAMMLAIIPCAAAFPSDRMLLFVGIGAHALLANLLWFYARKIRLPARGALSMLVKSSAVLVTVVLLVIHLLMAPALLFSRAYAFKWFGDSMNLGAASLDPAIEPNKTLVVLNVIHPYVVSNLFATRAAESKPLPEHMVVLSVAMNSAAGSTLYRPDEYSLVVQPDQGYYWDVFRGPTHPFEAGEKIELDDVSVEILSVSKDGYPLKARFEFAHRLEDSRYVWKKKRNNFEFVDFRLPRVGQKIRVL